MLIPEGALLFAMHPAVVDDALGRTQVAPEERVWREGSFTNNEKIGMVVPTTLRCWVWGVQLQLMGFL